MMFTSVCRFHFKTGYMYNSSLCHYYCQDGPGGSKCQSTCCFLNILFDSGLVSVYQIVLFQDLSILFFLKCLQCQINAIGIHLCVSCNFMFPDLVAFRFTLIFIISTTCLGLKIYDVMTDAF